MHYTPHPTYKHPFIKGVQVTPVEYDRLYRALTHSVDAAELENVRTGIMRACAVRILYFPN